MTTWVACRLVDENGEVLGVATAECQVFQRRLYVLAPVDVPILLAGTVAGLRGDWPISGTRWPWNNSSYSVRVGDLVTLNFEKG